MNVKKFVFVVGGFLIFIGYMNGKTEQLAIGVLLIVGFFLVQLLWRGTKAGASATKNLISQKVRDAQEEREWRKNLNRELEREEKLAKVRNNSMLAFYEQQAQVLVNFKREGTNMDKELLEMREKILALEGKENQATIDRVMAMINNA
jgi:hypothetical protein